MEWNPAVQAGQMLTVVLTMMAAMAVKAAAMAVAATTASGLGSHDGLGARLPLGLKPHE